MAVSLICWALWLYGQHIKMGRPSIDVQNERQCSNSDKLKVSETACDSPVVGVCSACTSPLLFSDGSPSTIDIVHTSTHCIALGLNRNGQDVNYCILLCLLDLHKDVNYCKLCSLVTHVYISVS